MPTVSQFKDKAGALSLSKSGNKMELESRIRDCLSGKIFADIKKFIPSDEKCPKDKSSLMELLINTEKPLTVVTTIIEINKTSTVSHANQTDHVIRTTKEYRKTSIPKKLREAVWEKYIGADLGMPKCPCCNITDIKQGGSNSWHCSHVTAEVNGGETNIDNLRVLCPGCNNSMGTMNLYDFAIMFSKDAVDRLRLSKSEPEFESNPAKSKSVNHDVNSACADSGSESKSRDHSVFLKDSLIVMCKFKDISTSKKNKAQLLSELDNIPDILNEMNCKDLKQICRIESIKGYSKMKKAELLSFLLS